MRIGEVREELKQRKIGERMGNLRVYGWMLSIDGHELKEKPAGNEPDYGYSMMY